MDSINLCYEMCDYIEQNGVVKLAGNVKLRDNLVAFSYIHINDRWKIW